MKWQLLASCSARQGWVGQSKCQNSSEPYVETAENASETLKIAQNPLEIARNRSNLASADVTLQLRLGFWPVKSGQCSNVLPIVSVVGPNYQFQVLPTLNSMFLESLIGRVAACSVSFDFSRALAAIMIASAERPPSRTNGAALPDQVCASLHQVCPLPSRIFSPL